MRRVKNLCARRSRPPVFQQCPPVCGCGRHTLCPGTTIFAGQPRHRQKTRQKCHEHVKVSIRKWPVRTKDVATGRPAATALLVLVLQGTSRKDGPSLHTPSCSTTHSMQRRSSGDVLEYLYRNFLQLRGRCLFVLGYLKMPLNLPVAWRMRTSSSSRAIVLLGASNNRCLQQQQQQQQQQEEVFSSSSSFPCLVLVLVDPQAHKGSPWWIGRGTQGRQALRLSRSEGDTGGGWGGGGRETQAFVIFPLIRCVERKLRLAPRHRVHGN